jgi:two-component system sensor kinase FixL
MTTSTPQHDMASFEALLDAAVDGIVMIDAEGNILRFNQAAQQMFGYDESEVTGRNVNMLMPEPDHSEHDRYLRKYRETGRAAIIGIGREVKGLRRTGETFHISLSVGEVNRSEGVRFVGIIRDLSEQRQIEDKVHMLERQLMHADRLVVLGELTAGIAHEINQPLTAIAAYADAGRHMTHTDRPVDVEEMHMICRRVAEQSRRAASVVYRLRKLSRTGSVSKSSHDLNQIINNILLLFDYEIKNNVISLNFHAGSDIPHLYVDEVQIQQIMVNLVKNSIDAIVEAGRSGGRIDIYVRKADTEVEIAVQDNGPGVPEESLMHMFEPFFTTKPKGVGLGLAICRHIAAAHGGRLGLSLPEEGGSCFTLTLPLEYIG